MKTPDGARNDSLEFLVASFDAHHPPRTTSDNKKVAIHFSFIPFIAFVVDFVGCLVLGADDGRKLGANFRKRRPRRRRRRNDWRRERIALVFCSFTVDNGRFELIDSED